MAASLVYGDYPMERRQPRYRKRNACSAVLLGPASYSPHIDFPISFSGLTPLVALLILDPEPEVAPAIFPCGAVHKEDALMRGIPGQRILLAALAFMAAACSPTQQSGIAPAPSAQDTAAVRSAIEAANAKFVDAFKRGDKAGLMANYADDAVIMMPNEVAWRGKAELDKGFTSVLKQMSFKEGGAKTEDVMLAGDLAVETGTSAWTFQPKSGAEVREKGKYLTVWKRQADGSWKIIRDINNSDLPAAK